MLNLCYSNISLPALTQSIWLLLGPVCRFRRRLCVVVSPRLWHANLILSARIARTAVGVVIIFIIAFRIAFRMLPTRRRASLALWQAAAGALRFGQLPLERRPLFVLPVLRIHGARDANRQFLHFSDIVETASAVNRFLNRGWLTKNHNCLILFYPTARIFRRGAFVAKFPRSVVVADAGTAKQLIETATNTSDAAPQPVLIASVRRGDRRSDWCTVQCEQVLYVLIVYAGCVRVALLMLPLMLAMQRPVRSGERLIVEDEVLDSLVLDSLFGGGRV